MLENSMKEGRKIIRAYRTATENEKDGALLNLRLNALKELEKQLKIYCNGGFNEMLISRFIKRKAHFISLATSVSEAEMILCGPHIKYDGRKIVSAVPKEYFIPEEELMFWALIAKEKGLSRLEKDRFAEVFEMVYPEECAKGDFVLWQNETQTRI